MSPFLTIEILLGVLALTATSALGAIIHIRNPKSWTHRLFLLLAIAIDFYIIVNFLSLHPPRQTPDDQLFWIRAVMFVTSFIGPILVLLVHTFPGHRITMRRRFIALLLFLMIASAAASLMPFVFQSIHYPEGEPIPVPGPGMPVFFLDFIGLFILSFIILILKHRRAQGEEKMKLRHLLAGVIASFSLMGISTVIFVVILRTSAFVFLGPIFPVILITFIAYAIVKHNLFSIQIFATQMFVSVLAIVLFTKIFSFISPTQATIDSFIFFLTSVFGYMLIRSVRKEVTQRRELERMTQELAKSNHALQQIDRTKSEFISIASHQLRAPLTIIKGYISLLRDGTIKPAAKKGKEAMERVASSTEQMVGLINSLLNLSRIESGKIRYEMTPGDLGGIVQKLVDAFGPRAAEKHLALRYNKQGAVPSTVFDADKMREVVTNLLDNAVKYTPEGEITVMLEARAGRIRLSVQDNGIGMSANDTAQAFEKFARSESARRVDPGGMGIGLYFVRRVMEDHDGTARAESKGPGKGSTFTIELPIRKKVEVKSNE
ncbi:MAG: ATP-binding protein [Patescibacteria group bacterium]